MTMQTKTPIGGTIKPSRVYRAAEKCWYRIDYSLFGRVYLYFTDNFRYIKETN